MREGCDGFVGKGIGEPEEQYLCKTSILEIQRQISRDLWEEIGIENGWFE